MIIPLKKFVLIAESKKVTATESGIILEGQGTGLSKTGIVLAVGPDAKQVSVGDEVYPIWSKGVVVNVDSAIRLMISEEHIVAVLEK